MHLPGDLDVCGRLDEATGGEANPFAAIVIEIRNSEDSFIDYDKTSMDSARSFSDELSICGV